MIWPGVSLVPGGAHHTHLSQHPWGQTVELRPRGQTGPASYAHHPKSRPCAIQTSCVSTEAMPLPISVFSMVLFVLWVLTALRCFQNLLGPGHSDQRCDQRAAPSQPPAPPPWDRAAESSAGHQTEAALPRAVSSERRYCSHLRGQFRPHLKSTLCSVWKHCCTPTLGVIHWTTVFFSFKLYQ